MGVYILIFELFVIITYGIFARTGNATSGATTINTTTATSTTSGTTTTITTTTTTTYQWLSDIETPLYFTLAFTLLNMKYRMYQWNQLTNYLFIVAITFQMNTLYLMFWESAIKNGFSATTNINSYYLIINVQCVLAILVTTFQFTGKLTIEQIFALCMVEIFAFAFNFSVCLYGLRALTGGGTITIFLFGYIFAVPIRKFVCDEQIENQAQQKQRYFTLTMKIIGLVLMIILWFNFTSTTAKVDIYYTISLFNTNTLIADAYIQMFLGFSSAIGTSIGLRIMGEKIVLQKFIHTLVLTGMFLSSSSIVIIDPFASLLMGMFAPILLYILQKYLPDILVKGYSIQAIILCALGGIFDCIFIAGRNNRSPSLAENPYKQGGLVFGVLIITTLVAGVFGLLAALILRCFHPKQSINKDNMTWFIDQQTLPIYKDDPIFKRLMGENTDMTLRQENVLFNLKKNYITEKQRQNVQQGRIIKQKLDQSAAR